MKKQKICIIGGSLTGLATAISLSNLDLEIDLILGNDNHNFQSNRTTAISQDNFNFLNTLNISKSLKKYFWPCETMKLYSAENNKKFSEVFELNHTKEKKILYMIENSKIYKLMINKIKKVRSISLIKNQKISKINNIGLLKSIKIKNKNFKYNLIIICTGSNSDLAKNEFENKTFENLYDEVSVISILKHSFLKNNIARQIFLDNEILALLPISNTKTSIVWTLKKNIKKNNLYLEKKIKSYSKNFLKNIKLNSRIETRSLNYLIRKKYYKERTLLFGDALHVVHPFVGQGFNMTLRDLKCLKNIFTKKINLGLDIGNSDTLSEFSKEIKSSNFAFSLSINFLKDCFSINNKYFKGIRNGTLKNINKSSFIKNIFFNVADKGFKF